MLPSALAAVEATMQRGRLKHPGDDWLNQAASHHVERASQHLAPLEAGEGSEPHLAHTATRLLMALELAWERAEPHGFISPCGQDEGRDSCWPLGRSRDEHPAAARP